MLIFYFNLRGKASTKPGNIVGANSSSSLPSCWIFIIPAELSSKLALTHDGRRVGYAEREGLLAASQRSECERILLHVVFKT